MTQQAVIYCRVSSSKQVTEGHGLASQETRCREYAKHKGYDVIDVFRDEGLSDKLLDRPNMKAMLAYIKKRKTEQFFDRITETYSETLMTAYEKKIRKLEEEKIILDEKIAKYGRPLASFDETYRTAFSFLSNPQRLWASDKLEHKRIVLKLAFSEPIQYCKKEGYRASQKSLPFSLLEGG